MEKKVIKKSQDESVSLNLWRYVNLLSNHIKFICITVMITSTLAFITSYLLPKEYIASSSLAVEENIVSDLVEGIAITTSAAAKIRLLEVQLLSRELLSSVISLLELDLHVSTPAEHERLVTQIRSNTNIRHDRGRGVFYVSFRHGNPVAARDFVNTLIGTYIEQSASDKREESFDATDFLGSQIEIFQERIDKAQEAIDKYKAEQGMYLSLNESFVQQRINTLNNQLDNLRIEKNRLNSEKHMLSDASRLTEELREREVELRNARSIYTEKHPIPQRLMIEVENLKIRLAELENDPEFESVNAEYQVIQIELAALEETEKSVLGERDENLQNLEALPAIKTKLSELEQAKANEMIIYQQLVSRFGRSEVSKQMELQDKAVSFRVIDAAVVPTRFVSPMRYLIMLGGIAAGFALSIGFIIAKSIIRPQIHSADDLNVYSTPLLVKLPVIVQPAVSARKRIVNIVFIAITACIIGIVCIAAGMEFLGLPYIERILPF